MKNYRQKVTICFWVEPPEMMYGVKESVIEVFSTVDLPDNPKFIIEFVGGKHLIDANISFLNKGYTDNILRDAIRIRFSRKNDRKEDMWYNLVSIDYRVKHVEMLGHEPTPDFMKRVVFHKVVEIPKELYSLGRILGAQVKDLTNRLVEEHGGRVRHIDRYQKEYRRLLYRIEGRTGIPTNTIIDYIHGWEPLDDSGYKKIMNALLEEK